MTGTWVPGAEGSGFGLDHLPYGVFSTGSGARVGARVGAYVLDLAGALGDDVFTASSLNPFMSRGRVAWTATRTRIVDLLSDERQQAAMEPHLLPLSVVSLQLPFDVADYVDYYCCLEHASNIGRIFRPDEEPLKPNWRHLPVGYHGRAGTVVPSGTPIVRPRGQRKSPGDPAPGFGPSVRLDIEAEMGFVVGSGSPLGSVVAGRDFREHVFGVVLVNDWSARDIQAWEYVPLGPYLGKSFATSISPWVTPLEALDAARIPARPQEPEPLPYLEREEAWGLDLTLGVTLNGEVVSQPPYAGMYWTPDQMLAHMTVNGASLRTGDLYASGTVSGSAPGQRGSLIEVTWNGAEPVTLADGSTRTFLDDGDTVTLTASAPGTGGSTIALGEVTGTVRPAL